MAHHLAALVFAVDDYEPSKVPFYIGGGVLALWAVFLGFVGLRAESFPENTMAARAVMGVSAVLVAFAIATALITS
jgi:hypothetical protein